MRRRRLLASGGLALGVGLAGCLDSLTGGGSGRPTQARVEDPPDAVYVPTHVEGMEMAGMARDGRLRFALSYSFPHAFWLVTGDRRRTVDIREADSVHLMVSAWDSETGMALPTSNATVSISQDGEAVVEKSLWAMLSQNMGVHLGDNVALPGEGTYDVALSFGPPEARGIGDLAGALADSASGTFQLEYSPSTLSDLPYETFPDRQGERDAVAPMEMEMQPTGQLAPAGDLPGRALGEGTSGDATVVAQALDAVPAGVEGEGTYLAVSARTPHNRYPVPLMALSATLSRGSRTVFDGELTGAIHHELGYHYGAVVDGVEAGDELTVGVDAPPQVARHEGYETAFLEMDPVSVSV